MIPLLLRQIPVAQHLFPAYAGVIPLPLIFFELLVKLFPARAGVNPPIPALFQDGYFSFRAQVILSLIFLELLVKLADRLGQLLLRQAPV